MVAIFAYNGKVRVDIVVILRIVFMVGRGNEKGIEIDCFNAQILQIVQLLPYTLQVSAVKTTHVELVGEFIPFPYTAGMPARIIIFVVAHVVLGIAVTEPVGKNLIKYYPLCPIWYGKVGVERKIEFGLTVFHAPQTVIAGNIVVIAHYEVIINLFFCAFKGKFVVVESMVRLELGHLVAYSVYNRFRL